MWKSAGLLVRRVVTGHDADGKAVFVSDDQVDGLRPGLIPGTEFHRLWGGDQSPQFPDGGDPPDQPTYFPPVGGFRFGLFSLPPATLPDIPPADTNANSDVGALYAEVEDMLPGLASYVEPDNPGMHTTATIDFEVVLSGEVVLELDDGAEVILHPGDTVVQNGTRHRWSNRGDSPATLAVFIVGAHHDRVG